MPNDNKRNLLFFKSSSMRGLYEVMDKWQAKNGRRFQSTSIEKDGEKYCCIAPLNPTEVFRRSGSRLLDTGRQSPAAKR